MSLEVVCIDGMFPAETLKFYSQYGVITPEEGSLYTIRDVIFNTGVGTGLLLEEIVNPHVPVKHPVLGWIDVEPNWHPRRFTTLMGELVTDAMLREVRRDLDQQKVRELIPEKLYEPQ